MTTQDLTKGIDITGLTSVSGSQMNQLVDAGRSASDKGLVITSTDTAIGVPDVPNPNLAYIGITPTWWTRYLWVRQPHADDPDPITRLYYWAEEQTSDATYLKWFDLTGFIEDVETIANDAASDATSAIAQSNAALAAANTATALAGAAVSSVATLDSDLQALTVRVDDLEAEIDELWNVGDYKWTARDDIYSTVANEGWLVPDGSAVSRVIFANLFDQIGTTYGPGDGSTTFNIPNAKARTLISVNPASGGGLSQRDLGQQTIGEELHTMTLAELVAHTHPVRPDLVYSGAGGPTGASGSDKFVDPATTTGSTGSTTPFNVMQPSIVGQLLIKT